MKYEKITEGSNEFCKEVITSINIKTKAELEKELKNFLLKKSTTTNSLVKEEAKINAQLNVFK